MKRDGGRKVNACIHKPGIRNGLTSDPPTNATISRSREVMRKQNEGPTQRPNKWRVTVAVDVRRNAKIKYSIRMQRSEKNSLRATYLTTIASQQFSSPFQLQSAVYVVATIFFTACGSHFQCSYNTNQRQTSQTSDVNNVPCHRRWQNRE